MQLIIAAPENISPEKGTTYKLVRKVFIITNTSTLSGCAALPRSCRKRCRERRTLPEVSKGRRCRPFFKLVLRAYNL
jgi:hypothetical protein